MSILGNAIQEETTKTYTENGCPTYSSSLNYNVDFFFMAGASRGQRDRVLDMFIKAYIENNDIALANLFYLRDCRNGIGERDLTRAILKHIGINYPNIVSTSFLDKIVEYGRVDDILSLMNSDETYKTVIQYIKENIENNNSLFGKWLPSENTSSAKTKALAKKVREGLGLTSKEYRHILSTLRKEQHLIETAMTNKDYSNVKYESLPSQAHFKHISAFKRNDADNYTKYIESLQKGEKKVNTSTLVPVQIGEKYIYTCGRPVNDNVLNEMWKNLPDMYEGREENALVVCDTSGSMFGMPLSVAVSLSLYIAERNKGKFHNEFITFSEHPNFQEIKGNDLYEKFNSIVNANWGMNTNLEAVFNLILNSCKKNNIPESECPKRIYIISDMEFDSCCGYSDKTMFENIKIKYNQAGYKLPQLFFWNVNSHQNNVPVRYNQQGVALISGYAPNILKYIIGKEDISPENIMMDTLKRYM